MDMSNVNLKGKDILLLFLYVPGKTDKIAESIVGATRLTKAMFLFDKEIKKDFKSNIESFPEFMAWKFGPWSDELFDDIEFFEGIDFVSSKKYSSLQDSSLADEEEFTKWTTEFADIPLDPEVYNPKSFSLTDTGRRYVEENLLPKITEIQLGVLTNFKKKIATLSLYSLLQYVYKKYSTGKEDWTKESIIKGDVLK